VSRQGPAQLSKRETWVQASSSNEQNRTEYRKTRLADRPVQAKSSSSGSWSHSRICAEAIVRFGR
jgi:hypothetical protein